MNPSTDEENFYKVDNLILSSSQHIRHLFKLRWKTETSEDWIDDQDHIQNFFEDLGKSVFEKALPYQKKKLLATCSTEDWDISLLDHVIRYFETRKKYWKENKAIRKLTDVRNDRAHRNSKTYSQSEYNETVKIFQDCLSILGMETSEVERLIERAGVTSPLKAHEYVKLLFERADHLIKDGNLDAALERYSEAISTPNLLPVNLGETYEKRADCYLKSMESLVTDDKKCSLALSDVDKALELNSASWTANYLAAKCYRIKNDTSKAIQYYETALSISPAQKQVQNDLETCKVLAGVQPKYVDLRPTKGSSDKLQVFSKDKNKLDDSVWRGHQYRFGIKVDQDYTKAVAFYTKADKQGNIEASYHLAECCYFGHGVQQDYKKAFEKFKRVAETEVGSTKQAKILSRVAIVGDAQYATGLCYENGTGVEEDLGKAAFWYQKAMGNGVGRAANNLGILYSNGFGVEKDTKTGEEYWKKGVNLEDENSAECLVGYYCEQLEPEMACRMFEVGRVLKNQRLVMLPDEEFNRKIDLVKAEKAKLTKKVAEYEKRHKLKSSGLLFKQRVDRVETHSNPKSECNKQPVENGAAKPCENWEDNYQPLTAKMITELNQKGKDGSEEAIRILQLTVNNNELIYILETTKEFFRACKLKLINLFYDCATTAFHFVVFKTEENRRKLEKIVFKLYEDQNGYSEEDQMKIRYCYLRLNLWKSLTSVDDQLALQILKEGLDQYPDNQHYFELLLLVYGYRSIWGEGIICANEALQKFPENTEILYFRAAHLRNSNADITAVTEAYKDFVNKSPQEHRKVPEAYYQISYGYIKEFEKSRDKDTLKLIESNFHEGEKSEYIQLPCYLPYQESDARVNVTRFIEKRRKKKSQSKLELEATEQQKNEIDNSEYLLSADRKKHIKEHRKLVNKSKDGSDGIMNLNTGSPELQQMLAKKMSSVKPITLREMKCTEDKIFENRVIDLTIIEDPITTTTSIYVVVEDENKNTMPLYIFNIEVDQEFLEEFQPGCRIGLVNPYMWFDDKSELRGIRSDEPLCIVYLEKIDNMCRCCGGENATKNCSVCKRPYCSKYCRDVDWKKFSHKLICSTG